MMNINLKKNNVMKRLHIKLIKWISNKLGYKIAILKAANGTTIIEGDKELLRYVDITGYFFKKEPLKRTFPKFVRMNPPLRNLINARDTVST